MFICRELHYNWSLRVTTSEGRIRHYKYIEFHIASNFLRVNEIDEYYCK